MGASPFFYVEMFNPKTGNWDKIDVYRKDEKGEFIECSLWPWNGTHELFSILGLENSSDSPTIDEVHFGLPIHVSEEMKKEYEAHIWESYKPEAIWINLADMKLYLNRHPKVKDYEAMVERYEEDESDWNEYTPIYMDNPMKTFIDRVESFLEIWDDFWKFNHGYSDVRVICWLEW